MKSNLIITAIIGLVVGVGGVSWYMSARTGDAMMTDTKGDAMMEDQATGTVMMKDEGGAMMEKDNDAAMVGGDAMMMQKGSYEVYSPEKLALAEKGKVVLFFRAVWCPTCKALDADIRAHLSAIPDGLTILDVDYDNSAALKQKYGVTYQHTLVQVDAKGAQLAKWSSSPTLVELISHVQ